MGNILFCGFLWGLVKRLMFPESDEGMERLNKLAKSYISKHANHTGTFLPVSFPIAQHGLRIHEHAQWIPSPLQPSQNSIMLSPIPLMRIMRAERRVCVVVICADLLSSTGSLHRSREGIDETI